MEGSQSLFTQIRQLQNTFNENLTDAANKLLTNYTVASATKLGNEFKNISDNLAYVNLFFKNFKVLQKVTLTPNTLILKYFYSFCKIKKF